VDIKQAQDLCKQLRAQQVVTEAAVAASEAKIAALQADRTGECSTHLVSCKRSRVALV
jgi:hypothetical protein